ncbi:GcrA family cell cycle regulator [Rhizobium sp. L1K21]|uniref:GcrA family cell cycle regulator n=1 Tax=Rhizobium sp. L1K21 TaxID=2954933 RepID=UPI00209313A4|nr:GcrA family cell cycle regulator [Rhizobium sp. L1K21]
MSWTDERVEKLKKLWAEGLSASQIAAQLGGVSRNAVIGKVHRLSLPGRAKAGGTAAPRAPKRQAPAPRAPSYNATSRPAAPRSAPRSVGATALRQDPDASIFEEIEIDRADNVVVPISRRLALTELSERTCKWPVGDPLKEDFHFCGNDSPENTPYCTYHARLAYQPTGERRRAASR